MKISQYPQNADGTPMKVKVGLLTDKTGNGGARLASVPTGPDNAPIDAEALILIDNNGNPITQYAAFVYSASQALNTAAANTAIIQGEMDTLNAIGGGTLIFPAGIIQHNGLTFRNKIRYVGMGFDTNSTSGTMFLYIGNGDGVIIANVINSSTAANITIEHITFKNQTRVAGKGCFADTGSTYLRFYRCAFIGSDRGLILDQSEMVVVDGCDFEGVASQICLMWIVNGADRHLATQLGYTNMITVRDCEFNGFSTTYGIIDDGGYTHTFRDNNYNGCVNHMVVAGVATLVISGGEWESAVGTNLVFASLTRFSSQNVGQCSPVKIENVNMVPTAGQYCVDCVSVGSMTVVGGFYGNSTAVKFHGMANCNSLNAIGMQNGGGGANFDAFATTHWEVHDGMVRTNPANLGNYANDAAAATGGVLIGQYYRNGSISMVRIA